MAIGTSEVQGLGHQVAVMVGKAAAAVELDGGVAVVDLEMKDFGVVLGGGLFSEVKELGADSLPAVGGFDEEFVDPSPFAAVFEAVIETEDQIGNGGEVITNEIDDAVDGILQEFGEVSADGGFVEGFFPGVVELHAAHHLEKRFEVGERCLGEGDGHKSV